MVNILFSVEAETLKQKRPHDVSDRGAAKANLPQEPPTRTIGMLTITQPTITSQDIARREAITLTTQEFNRILAAFFSVAPDHVGVNTFHADVRRVGASLLEAMREHPSSSIGQLEAMAEELLTEQHPDDADENEHRLGGHEYGLSHRAA
jgi:hypothetical protein